MLSSIIFLLVKLYPHHFVVITGNAIGDMLTFYSEESAFMKLVETTKQGFTYWNQKCSG